MSIDRHAGNLERPRVTGPEEMVRTVLDFGIIPFFSNIIPGYSIEELTPGENWFDGTEIISDTPWDWKIACVQSGDIAYGKFLLGGKAAFASIRWYQELMNWRRSLPKYQPDDAQSKILAWMRDNGSIGIKEIRGLLGVKKGLADAAMARLMMQCRAVTGDITRVYRGQDLHYNGWQTSAFCKPEDLFDLGPCPHSPTESYELLRTHIKEIAPSATDKMINKLLD